MRKKMYWGIASLILIIGVVGVYFMLQPDSDTEPDKRYIVPSEADLEQARKTKQPPPGASPNGHWHDGKWHEEPHEVPMAQNDAPIAPPVKVPKPEKPTYDSPLTDHAKLLETHPVEALRLQTEERGHWSAQWIPPFPPDDQEAAEIAKAVYVWIDYYKIKGNSDKDPRPPEIIHADQVLYNLNRTFYEQLSLDLLPNPRMNDILKLRWARSDRPVNRPFIWESTFEKRGEHQEK